MELIEIVNEQGDFTGEVMDKDLAHDKNLLHNEVAVLIVNNDNQVLLEKRSANKRFEPNKWGLVAGHVAAFESLEKAALREVKEEIGINLDLNQLHSFSDREVKIADTNSHITYFFYARCNLKENQFVIQ